MERSGERRRRERESLERQAANVKKNKCMGDREDRKRKKVIDGRK